MLPCNKVPLVTDRILIIEDDKRLAEMVSNYLGEAGFADRGVAHRHGRHRAA